MTFQKIILSLVIFCTLSFSSYGTEIALTNKKIRHSLFASAIGDALGRVTEFISTTEDIFKKYPQGVTSFNSFTKADWQNIPQSFIDQRCAPYTDDTRMALLVTDTLIASKKYGWNLETTMDSITRAFIADLDNTTYGWTAPYRAPGNACLKGVTCAQQKTSPYR